MHQKKEAFVEQLLKKMSLCEKIGQLNQPETPTAENLSAFKERVRRGEVGSILMSVGATAGNDPQGAIDVDFYNEIQHIAVEESPSGIPVLFGIDAVRGHGLNDHATIFPTQLAAACTWDTEEVRELEQEIR